MPVVVIVILTALLVPLPPIILDILISTNISLSVVVPPVVALRRQPD